MSAVGPAPAADARGARVVFMGSPAWAVPSLDALARAAPALGAEIVGVFSQPDKPAGRRRSLQACPVKTAAGVLGLPVFTPARIRAAEAQGELRRLAPDLIVVCAYGQIFPRAMLDLPPLGCYNLHFSRLPRWRGASPIQAAILAGDATTGVCLQRMVEALDAGPLAAQSAPVAIGPDDTAGTLGARLAGVSAALLRDALPRLLTGSVVLTPQDAAGVTTCRTLRKEDGAVDFATESARQLERRVRAYQPWPGCHCFLGARRIGLAGVEVADDAPGEPPTASPPGVILPGGRVATAAGFIRLRRVTPEGKAPMTWEAFAHGNPQALGAKLTPAPV